ncbi:MAG: hypothetical protein EA340_15340 [Nitriliruptor sp.]|nr:MAG: hypothetical protein EA340_15340 [Nitriliruptor sp.]
MDLLVVGLIAFAAYWVGWWVGRTDRPGPAPWPDAEDCEPLTSFEQRFLSHLPTHDDPWGPGRRGR